MAWWLGVIRISQLSPTKLHRLHVCNLDWICLVTSVPHSSSNRVLDVGDGQSPSLLQVRRHWKHNMYIYFIVSEWHFLYHQLTPHLLRSNQLFSIYFICISLYPPHPLKKTKKKHACLSLWHVRAFVVAPYSAVRLYCHTQSGVKLHCSMHLIMWLPSIN